MNSSPIPSVDPPTARMIMMITVNSVAECPSMVEQCSNSGRNRPRTLEDPERAADDENEKDDVRRVLQTPRNRGQETEKAHGVSYRFRGLLGLVGLVDSRSPGPLTRVVLGNALVRSGHDQRALAPVESPSFP